MIRMYFTLPQSIHAERLNKLVYGNDTATTVKQNESQRR